VRRSFAKEVPKSSGVRLLAGRSAQHPRDVLDGGTMQAEETANLCKHEHERLPAFARLRPGEVALK